MSASTVKQLLAGQISIDSTVQIKGWLRSRRDSKAGISFLAIHDGSCFDPIQAVVPAELANYEAEILHAGAGCGVVVEGQLVASH